MRHNYGPPCFPRRLVFCGKLYGGSMGEPVYPLMTPYEIWRAAWRVSQGLESGHESTRRNPYCRDCTRAYQEEQLLAGNCNHPEVRFKTDKDGFVTGYAPRPPRDKRKRAGEVATA